MRTVRRTFRLREWQLEAILAAAALVLVVPWLWGLVDIVRMMLWGTP